MTRVYRLAADAVGWLTLTRYIPSKLGRARRNELTASDFEASLPEEHWVANHAGLWFARRPVTMRDAVACCKHIVLAGLIVGVWAWALLLFSTYFFFQILSQFLGDTTQPLWYGWVIITTMLVNSLLSNFLVSLLGTISIEIGSAMKAGMEALVFRVTQNLKHAEDTGMVNTLVSNDADRIFAMGQFVAWTATSGLMLVASMVLTCVLMGWPAVPGLVFIVLVMVAARLLGTWGGKIRFGVLPHTDARIGLISELLQSVFFVKMYVYEDHFWERICHERNLEVAKLIESGIVQAATLLTVNASSYVPAMLSMIIYIAVGGSLTPSIAFTALSLYFGMWFPMIMFSNGLARIGQAAPCFARLRTLLEKEQIQPRGDWTKETANPSVSLKDCCFRFSDPLDPAAAAPFEVRHVSFEARAPAMVMLCGPVGSGKTAALLGILGQLERASGETALAGTIGFAAQTPFILNATLRDNVLFGSPMHEARYAACIKTACLEADLRQLPDGEYTVIGEKGVNLSGGQKQRVSVARALYNDAQVLILDDVLSALDALVQREFFMGLLHFCRENGKLVVFANHHLHFAEHFDEIVVLQVKTEGDLRWGEQVERGSFAQLTALRDGVFATMIEDYQEGTQDEVQDGPPKEATAVQEVRQNAQQAQSKVVSARGATFTLIKDEAVSAEALGWDTVKYYFSRFGVGLVFVAIAFVAFSALRVYFEFHVAAWVGHTTALSFEAWSGVLVAITFGILSLMFAASAGLAYTSLRASKLIHNEVLRRVLDATMGFFWSTPLGRVLNRLGRDVDQLDIWLPFAMDQSWGLLLNASGIFVAVAIIFPIALVSFPALFLGFGILVYFLRAGMRQFRRLAGVVRSFVMTSLEVSIGGAPLIRAMDVYPRFEKDFHAKAEVEVNANFYVWELGNFVGLYFNLLVSVFTFVVAVIAISTPRTGAGALGSLAVSYSVRLAAAFQWSVRQLIDAESYATSVERLLEYTQVPMEDFAGVVETPSDWPSEGRVTFENVRMRYRPDLPDVLKDVSFEIAPSTSLGIVGRTGSAKSSLLIALLRFVPLSGGTIRIDGVDISMLDLRTVRRQLAIIPQDPVL